MTRLAGFSWLASVGGAVVLQENDVGVTTGVTEVRQTFSCSLDQFLNHLFLHDETEWPAPGFVDTHLS
jgi:hypothetical protein